MLRNSLLLALLLAVLLGVTVAPVVPVLAAPGAQSGAHPSLTLFSASYSTSTGDMAAGADYDWGTGGAYSGPLSSGDKVVAATVDQADTYFMVGFGSSQTIDYHAIDFALYACSSTLCGGRLFSFESGSPTEIGSYVSGDRLAVAFVGGDVEYLKNGAVLATSSGAALAGTSYINIALKQPSGWATDLVNLTYGTDVSTATPTRTVTATGTATATRTATGTTSPTGTATGTPVATSTPSSSLGDANILRGRSGCVVDYLVKFDFSDCAYTKGEQTDGATVENCDPHGHIYFDLGAYYYLEDLQVFFEGTAHGAGGDLQWYYYDVNEGWSQIPGAYSAQLSLDAWVSGDGSGVPPARYVAIVDLNYSAYYWCPNEVEVSGDVGSAPPTWTTTPGPSATRTPTGTPTVIVHTPTPGPGTATRTRTASPTPGSFGTRTATRTSTPTRVPTGTPATATPTITPGGPTPPPPTPTALPNQTSCGPHSAHLFYPASLGQSAQVVIENAGCIEVVGSPNAIHSGSFTCHLDCPGWRDGAFFGQGADVIFYVYDLRCVVERETSNPLQGACAHVQIIATQHDLDVYWSDPTEADLIPTTEPTGTPGDGTPTAVVPTGTPLPAQQCGLANQPPCIVQLLTPFPTQIPYPTPPFYPTALSAVGALGDAPAPVAGTALGVDTLSVGTGDSKRDFIKVAKYDYGCPVNLNMWDTPFTLCFHYGEIQALSFGGLFEIPLWPLAAVLLLIILRWLLNA